MKILISTVMVMVLSLSSLFGAAYLAKDEIRKDGEWTYVSVVLMGGTQSQAVIGKIKYRDKEVIGEKGHLLILPFGQYVWRGSYDKGHLRGWISLDSDTDYILSEIPSETLSGVYYTKKKG